MVSTCRSPQTSGHSRASSSNGASMLTTDASGKAQATFASDEGVEAFQLYADMVKDECALHISWEEGCQRLHRRQRGHDAIPPLPDGQPYRRGPSSMWQR